MYESIKRNTSNLGASVQSFHPCLIGSHGFCFQDMPRYFYFIFLWTTYLTRHEIFISFMFHRYKLGMNYGIYDACLNFGESHLQVGIQEWWLLDLCTLTTSCHFLKCANHNRFWTIMIKTEAHCFPTFFFKPNDSYEPSWYKWKPILFQQNFHVQW